MIEAHKHLKADHDCNIEMLKKRSVNGVVFSQPGMTVEPVNVFKRSNDVLLTRDQIPALTRRLSLSGSFEMAFEHGSIRRGAHIHTKYCLRWRLSMT
jgi:hypothetical protein